MYARAWLLLLVCARGRGLRTVKEYICKDPDTGTLHSLNTTWPSTTFCGNYTCKLRQINTTTNQPTSEIIVDLTVPQTRVPKDNDEKSTIDRNSKEDDFSLTGILSELNKDGDRLLNKEEIQKISELLHSVKKSDLEAIVELYNVAQEIYKGINLDSIEKSKASETELLNPKNSGIPRVSYWYEPDNGYRKESDMKTAGSEYKGTTTYPVRSQYELPYFYTQKNSNYPSYFGGTFLNNNDFGRIGYYQPQANSQSLASYYQQRGIYDISSVNPQYPCSYCPRGFQNQAPLTTNTGSIGRPNYAPSHGHTNNMMRPYLPSYNYSAQTYSNYNNYYKGNPWAYYDYYKTYPGYPYPLHVQVPRGAVSVNENVSPGPHLSTPADESNDNSKEEDDKSWKTESLSDTVINEIRANIAHGKLLNIPMKKRIKLERAARVIKLDQFKNRKTRSAPTEANDEEKISNKGENHEKTEENDSTEKEEVYETYIEKVACKHSTDPGYFRVGNSTLLYPDCCPQRIEDKQR